jgi:hypothetical protein
MCRYAFAGPYKEKWACFECRKSFKQRNRKEISTPIPVTADNMRLVPCPQCGRQMYNMGYDFKAPKQSDRAQWKKVEQLFIHGYNYATCGCGAGYRPQRLSEVPLFLQEQAALEARCQRESQAAVRADQLGVKRQQKRKYRLEKWLRKYERAVAAAT